MAGSPHVAIVVLSYNAREDTLECLESIRRVDFRPLTTIVVDNGSTDGTVEAVRSRFSSVELLHNDVNLGFAEGNNVGIRRALELGADYVLILNNDVEVDPMFIEPLIEEAERRTDAGALCSKILYFERPDLIWFAGATFDPRSGYNGRLIGYQQADGPDYADVREIDRACGAAMISSRAVLERVGGFDPELFLYSEDTDWSLRARKAGYRIYLVPESRIWHKVSVSSGGENSPTTLYYSVRNTLEVCERHASLGAFGTWRRRAILLGAHLVQAARSDERVAGLQAVVSGWRDFRARRFGPRRGSRA